jgi:hypothetical protein
MAYYEYVSGDKLRQIVSSYCYCIDFMKLPVGPFLISSINLLNDVFSSSDYVASTGGTISE